MRSITGVLSLFILMNVAPQPTVAQSANPVSHQKSGAAKDSGKQPSLEDAAVDRIITREHDEYIAIRLYHPIVETYIQDIRPDKNLGVVPNGDHYFLGLANMDKDIAVHSMIHKKHEKLMAPFQFVANQMSVQYFADGFLSEIFIDTQNFDRSHYRFTYVGREFLGEVRCLVFDVTPLAKSGKKGFKGRIWAEDHEYTIVRFNGIVLPSREFGKFDVHFDSWRINVQPDLWLPAYVFSHETHGDSGSSVNIKSQMRLWGYNLETAKREQEFSDLQIESSAEVQEEAAELRDRSPLEAEREWQRQAETNALDSLEHAGVLARVGEVDKVLNTVVNNIEVTNNIELEPELHCRVLLTSTFEMFSIGHTIVLSRGLIDVLPDEGTLAVMLAQEIADAMVSKPSIDVYGFSDLARVPTLEVMRRFSFQNYPDENSKANKKAIELLRNSPYRDKLANAGLFLNQLQAESKVLPALISPHLGNGVYPTQQLMASAPRIEPDALDQIAALPLGARLKLDPWNDNVELLKAKHMPLTSARDKMPFEVTPFMPFLVRFKTAPEAAKPEESSAAGSEAILRPAAQKEKN